MAERVRDGKGRYRRTTDNVARDIKAMEMYNQSKSWVAISAELGYGSPRNARRAVETILAQTLEQSKETANELRAKMLAKLQLAEQCVLDVLERQHVTVSNGKVIYHGDAPLLDDAPVLNAVDRLLHIYGQVAKLTGINAPVQVEAQVTETTQQDLELVELINSAKARVAADDARRGAAP